MEEVAMKTVKRVLCVVLALALGLAMFAPAVAGEELDPRIAEVQAIIEEYNATHGGTGALSVSYELRRGYDSALVITGEVTGATKSLELPEIQYVRYDWKATLTGETSGEALLIVRRVSFTGGELKTSGLAVEGIYVSINGGTVAGDIRTIRDVDGHGGNVEIYEGAFIGAIVCSIFGLSGNAVVNVTALSAEIVRIQDKAHLHFMENAAVNILYETYIETKAKITGSGARAFIKDAVLYHNAFSYMSGDAIIYSSFWYSSVAQFVFRWIFFPQAMLGF